MVRRNAELIETDDLDLDEFVDASEPSELHPSDAWKRMIERGNTDLDPERGDEWLINRLTMLFVEANDYHDIDALEFIGSLRAVSNHFEGVANAALEDHIEQSGWEIEEGG